MTIGLRGNATATPVARSRSRSSIAATAAERYAVRPDSVITRPANPASATSPRRAARTRAASCRPSSCAPSCRGRGSVVTTKPPGYGAGMPETDRPAPTPFAVTLAELAAADPDRPAITDGTRTVTRRELDTHTNRLAARTRNSASPRTRSSPSACPTASSGSRRRLPSGSSAATPAPVSAKLPRLELEAIVELADPSLVVGLDAPGRTGVPAGFEPAAELSTPRCR